MGVDAYITKFDAANLAATLRPLLDGRVRESDSMA